MRIKYFSLADGRRAGGEKSLNCSDGNECSQLLVFFTKNHERDENESRDGVEGSGKEQEKERERERE